MPVKRTARRAPAKVQPVVESSSSSEDDVPPALASDPDTSDFEGSDDDDIEVSDVDDIEVSDDDDIEASDDEDIEYSDDDDIEYSDDDALEYSDDDDGEDGEYATDDDNDGLSDEEEDDHVGEGITSAAAILRARGYKSHLVKNREDDLKYDLGNLVAFDGHPIDAGKYSADKEKALCSAARDSTQLLFNRIFSLETKRLATEGVIAVLPPAVTALPRAKRVPEEKPMTKWEEFAKVRGINNRKRERMLWDETYQEWRPRYGYKRANDELDQWLIEDKGDTAPGEDPWMKLRKEKQQRVKLNKKQAAKNLHRGEKPLPSAGEKIDTLERLAGEKQQLKKRISQTNASTASMGQFNKQLPGEEKHRIRTKAGSKKPAQFQPKGAEQANALKLLERMAVHEKVVDKETAGRRAIGKHHQQSGERRVKRTMDRQKKKLGRKAPK